MPAKCITNYICLSVEMCPYGHFLCVSIFFLTLTSNAENGLVVIQMNRHLSLFCGLCHWIIEREECGKFLYSLRTEGNTWCGSVLPWLYSILGSSIQWPDTPLLVLVECGAHSLPLLGSYWIAVACSKEWTTWLFECKVWEGDCSLLNAMTLIRKSKMWLDFHQHLIGIPLCYLCLVMPFFVVSGKEVKNNRHICKIFYA